VSANTEPAPFFLQAETREKQIFSRCVKKLFFLHIRETAGYITTLPEVESDE